MDHNAELGARNTAMFSLMLDTGARLSEVVTLKYDDVHLQERYIKVLGKGNKERIVAFGANCQRSLMHYADQNELRPTVRLPTSSFSVEMGIPCLLMAFAPSLDECPRRPGSSDSILIS